MHIYVYMHTHTYTYINTCMHTYVYTHMHAHIYIYIHMHTDIYMYIYIYTCKNIHTYINACMHVCMYICLSLGLKSSSKSDTSVSSQFRTTRTACYRHARSQSEAEDQAGEGSRRLALYRQPPQCPVPASPCGRQSSGRATIPSRDPGRSEQEGARHRYLRPGAAGRGASRRCLIDACLPPRGKGPAHA